MKFILTEPIEAVQYQEGLELEDGFMFKVTNKEGRRVTTLKPEGTPQTDAESLQNLADSYAAEGYSYKKVPFILTRSGVQNDINEGDYVITDADGLKRIESKAHFEATHSPYSEPLPVEPPKPEPAPAPVSSEPAPSEPEPFILPGKPDEEQPNQDGLVPAKEEDINTANDPHAVNHPEGEKTPVDVLGTGLVPEGTPNPEAPKREEPQAPVDSTSPEKTVVSKVAPKAPSKAAPVKSAPAKGKSATKGK